MARSRDRPAAAWSCRRRVHPHIAAVLATYLRELPHRAWSPSRRADGLTDPEDLRRAWTTTRPRVLIQTPNFFGCVETARDGWRAIAHAAGAPGRSRPSTRSAVRLLKPPGDSGRTSPSARASRWASRCPSAGRTSGFMACREEFMRKMPGRLVGRRRTIGGPAGFCLTLQTREQHIRRERATSNICTNQGLMALRAAIYLTRDRAKRAARGRVAVPGQGALRRRADRGTQGFRAAICRAVLQGVRGADEPRTYARARARAIQGHLSPACRSGGGTRSWAAASWSR